MAELNAPTYHVAVRALSEFTAKRGDLDLRFTPAPSAQEGIAGHNTVTSRRGAQYQSEVKLTGQHQALRLRGRADGYDAERIRLEEIKTYRGDFSAIPENHRALHWAQLKIYGTLQCRILGLKTIELALVYFDVDTQKETAIAEHCDSESLEHFCAEHCDVFLNWARQEQQHRSSRDAALNVLQFPHASFRHGQRELSEAVYKSIFTQRDLLAQAPTGIGKTIGTLFPLLKALSIKGIDKGFYLTAKTTGRELVFDAIHQIRQASPELPLRVLELVARDKACEYPERACHGESCPLAQGFYDRLPAARADAAATAHLNQATLKTIARDHHVCPYYLSVEMVRWADLIIGDYNYFFDASAMLYTLTLENDWRVSILVDEAHNLISRARDMYSARLTTADIASAQAAAPTALKRSLRQLTAQGQLLSDRQTHSYATYEDIPQKFLFALQTAVAKIGDHSVKYPADIPPALQRFYFDALHFCNLAEAFGPHSLCDIEKHETVLTRQNHCQIALRNIVPAPFLKARFAAAQSTTLFSATLFPAEYHRDLLGLQKESVYIDVPSPFTSDQLDIRIASHISTRFNRRSESVEPIAQLIREQYNAKPGNYIAYFSSFDYLGQVANVLAHHDCRLPIRRQTREMDEGERQKFIDAFTPFSCDIGFAVLGGAFGEGIDLPGDRLIGAFVATLGLPQINTVNEQFKRRLSDYFGEAYGYDYTYFYPGLQKVVQAAGRVIRTTDDRGTLYLIDDRFARRATHQLLPQWWQLKIMQNVISTSEQACYRK